MKTKFLYIAFALVFCWACEKESNEDVPVNVQTTEHSKETLIGNGSKKWDMTSYTLNGEVYSECLEETAIYQFSNDTNTVTHRCGEDSEETITVSRPYSYSKDTLRLVGNDFRVTLLTVDSLKLLFVDSLFAKSYVNGEYVEDYFIGIGTYKIEFKSL